MPLNSGVHISHRKGVPNTNNIFSFFQRVISYLSCKFTGPMKKFKVSKNKHSHQKTLLNQKQGGIWRHVLFLLFCQLQPFFKSDQLVQFYSDI